VNPVVSIFAQGAMGAGLAAALTQHGISVLTALEGRSAESAARARAAGMRSVPFERLADADLILSVLPPAEALPFARDLAPHLIATARKPLFVDCNAISPSTLQHVGAVIASTGTAFADVGIIGLPPHSGAPSPRLYAAGAGMELLESLNRFGLDVRPLHGAPGTASALKMSYAGITKGFTAIASAMILGADRAGIGADLRSELSQSEPELFASLTRRIQDMPSKAYRWVAEMREISEFLSEDSASSSIYDNIADLYSRLAADVLGTSSEAATLTRFFTR
jgi:L-threonate 2-dehydrogenase